MTDGDIRRGASYRYVVELSGVDRTQFAVVGGKGSHLGELSRLDDVVVPSGFCVTTDAFRRMVTEVPTLDGLIGRLSHLDPGDRDTIVTRSAEVRQQLERAIVPDDLVAAVTGALGRFDAHAAFAVRSSATAEDGPTASAAGQHDTYLNVVGAEAVLAHVSRCWASLFSDRAVTYRLRNGIDHHDVQMAVVVQRMIVPDASGVLFTADPVTSNRKVAAVEAVFGLGEALVSGLVSPDAFHVGDGRIIERQISIKSLAIRPVPSGGTEHHQIAPEQQDRPTLTDAQVVRLVELGRRIEDHFGAPQDIEWCSTGDDFQIVQSRPITTLFPIPVVDHGDERHVYVSVGHQQMMTDAMKPLGLSVWQLTSPAPLVHAAGRLFVDVTLHLATAAGRVALLDALGTSDPLIRDALQTVLDRGDAVAVVPDANTEPAPAVAPAPIDTDPAIVTELIERNRASVAAMQRDISTRSGSELFDFILDDIEEMRRLLFEPRSHRVYTTAIDATMWLNEHLHEWLGERNVADILTRSAPNNVTSEMGLALLDVADVIRPHPEVIAWLERVVDDGFLDELDQLAGGHAARAAIAGYLDEYGMRCVGEIDITRPRWSEHPAALVPMILGNIRNFEPGAARRRFEQGLQAAAAKEREVLERLRSLPDGDTRADETKRMIDRVRTFIGYREYPKYGMVSRYIVYKRALLDEAARLVEARLLRDPHDIFFLTFHELHDVVRTRRVDEQLIGRRKAALRSHQALTPPRVLTSDGECLNGVYRRDDPPAGALVGLAVSAGGVEGRARVVVDMADADLAPGDILVTAHTDPSWSPLFVTIGGLVTEVGGLMTHGAVVAREYGLPAVVGVKDATRLIEDGQRIRVDGTDGYVVLRDDGRRV